MLVKTKTIPYETLTKKSLDLFLKLIEGFSFSYIHSSDRRVYLKGKKKFDVIKNIIINPDFKEIFLIQEELNKISDTTSSRYQILKNKLDCIKRFSE